MSNNNQELNKKQNKESEEAFSLVRWLYDWIGTMLFAAVFVLILMTVFLRQVTVNGPSMNDTLHDKDRLLVSSFMYTPKTGDIVVVTHGDREKLNEPIIKRAIATGGQHVEIVYDPVKEQGQVFVDGVELKEDYIRNYTDLKPGKNISSKMVDGHTVYVLSEDVKEGYVFVMGDNRQNSLDSRSQENVGQVPVENIVGKAVFRIYPLEKFGPIS